MIRNSTARALLALLVLTVSTRALSAQGHPDLVHHRNDCRLAAQTISTGNPAPKMQWALQLIASCGDQGAVGSTVAAALTRLRTSNDTAQLLPLARATFGLVDGSVFSAALTVSGDGSASVTARAVSLLLLLTQLQPDADVSFGKLLATSATESCPRTIISDVPKIAGPVALPADAKGRALALAQSLQNTVGAPVLVRSAARCVVEGVSH